VGEAVFGTLIRRSFLKVGFVGNLKILGLQKSIPTHTGYGYPFISSFIAILLVALASKRLFR